MNGALVDVLDLLTARNNLGTSKKEIADIPRLPKFPEYASLHSMPCLGLSRLQNLVNIYTSFNNRNDSIYTEHSDLIFFMMQIGKIPDIFP